MAPGDAGSSCGADENNAFACAPVAAEDVLVSTGDSGEMSVCWDSSRRLSAADAASSLASDEASREARFAVCSFRWWLSLAFTPTARPSLIDASNAVESGLSEKSDDGWRLKSAMKGETAIPPDESAECGLAL